MSQDNAMYKFLKKLYFLSKGLNNWLKLHFTDQYWSIQKSSKHYYITLYCPSVWCTAISSVASITIHSGNNPLRCIVQWLPIVGFQLINFFLMHGDRGIVLMYEKWHFVGNTLRLGDSPRDNPLTCTVQWLPIVGSNWVAIKAWVIEFIYHMPKSSHV